MNSALNSSTEGQKIDFGDSSNDFQPQYPDTYDKISSGKVANLDKQRDYSDSFPSSKEEVDGTSFNLEDPSNPQSGSLLSMTSHVSPPSYGTF